MRPPSVDRLARELADTGLPHPLLVDVARAAIADGDPASARSRADSLALSLLRPVVNATGVLLHTNLGRAPLGAGVVAASSGSYTNLEFDLATGNRGSRSAHAAALLARAAGAEDALIVNNGAAAVLLVLAALAGGGGGVAVSRGELVEIGGGFRVPEVLAQSGARLIEVGTTNRTRLADYQRVVREVEDVRLVLKVHTSNYRIVGFTEATSVADLGDIGVPVVVDVGSGLLDAATPWLGQGGPPAWLAGEPAVRQTLEAGASLVTFSGDKLLGGPQSGIIAGSAELVEQCRRHPLARALRPGGLVLGALQSVALDYLDRNGGAIPFWRMAGVPIDELRRRATAIGFGEVVDCASVPGGGSAPGVTIPSAGIAVDGDATAALRSAHPPVIARVADGRTVLDLRSVDPAEDEAVSAALSRL
ncbi:MAG: L-seryl-tRNA(Sec) selenium transferase [Actinomycetota bacterium]|nr:L-seryl-tRNA(Sec) selenium transferase [Actinomycetota bacterium]